MDCARGPNVMESVLLGGQVDARTQFQLILVTQLINVHACLTLKRV